MLYFFVVGFDVISQADDGSESSGSEGDDDCKFHADALFAGEDLVNSFARKQGRPFDWALGNLVKEKKLSARSMLIRNLNFKNGDVRGGDLKRSIPRIAGFAKNEFAFMSALKADMGAKDEFDLLKKIGTMEFNDPLLIVLSLGAQMLRLEQRYLLTGIDFREAYGRRIDQLNTLMAVTYDIYQVGLTKQVVNLISEFASEYISPNFRKLEHTDAPILI